MNKSRNTIGMLGVGVLFLTILSSCAGTQNSRTERKETASAHNYAFAFLTTGKKAGELSKAEVAAAGKGHRAHIERMGAEGTLLLAGPFGEPKAEKSWRGIYVFDLDDMNEAYDLARSDPSIQAGLFDVTIMPWRSHVDLRPMRDQLEAEKSAGLPFAPAPYVLAIGEATKEVHDLLLELARKGKVVSSGRLGGDDQDQLLVLLKAKTVKEAKEWFHAKDMGVGWEFSSLWATALLGDLAPGRK